MPGQTTRPTTDKVKEALFSMIGPYFDGERVLDLFAGTGGLGIEALSRGAGRAVFVDANMRSIEVVRANLAATRLADKAEIYRQDAVKAIRLLEQRGGGPFDLVFLDPPYAMKTCDELLLELTARGLAGEDTVAVIEHESGFAYGERIGIFERRRLALYGETAISIYKYGGEA
ncbi:16S rRNA (guanine(966)-N(2))-methyltransferase RsmD [Cohnella sp. OV330]|nr:16S rRNA (guanine(966)-N(2))-methyltransferase RsmD [Cohnella sp. OV330]